MKAWRSSLGCPLPPGVFSFQVVCTQPLATLFMCPDKLLASVASAKGTVYAVSVLACLSSFGGGDLLCDLSSLMELRKVIDFQFVQLFSGKEGSSAFQTLYM